MKQYKNNIKLNLSGGNMGKRLIKMWFWNGIIANIVSNNPIEITNIPADKFLMLLYTTV